MSTTPRRTLLTIATAAAVVLGTAGPASAAGSVANSCAVPAPLTVWKADNSADGTVQGWRIERIPCGQGTSNVTRATVKSRPFYVREPGRAPFCMNPGQWYYPSNAGAGHETIFTPTISCSNGPASS